VDGEKTKEKGSPSLATGGTWEFIGNDITGLEMARPGRRSKADAHAMAGETMMVIQEASLVPRSRFSYCVLDTNEERIWDESGQDDRLE
jgi:hypothetical protein